MTPIEKSAAYARASRRAAKIIVEDVEKYGGPESIMGQWAAAILTKAKGVARPDTFDRKQGQLFEEAA